ncbi:serine protease inhibitor Kazal-type 12-like [Phascolarctos cinereus]|uniref:Serine protease inhibitor Kazal-type 12-like n=1 Tax=Phascolarctos cinereus TaxID=38626 RepID=A0A6P5JSM9_PHACI|nr:serine protease inhibitor Kazal-type 12-like [Phascolarctos cinereus]
MTSSRSSMFLLCLTCTFLIVDAVSQGGYQAQCKNFKAPAPGENTQCPNIQKPVCGTDGQTYKNLCEFCKVAMEQNGQLGYKHDGKC